MNGEGFLIRPGELELYESAQRMADAVNLHVLALRAQGERDRPAFVAVKLMDGRSDGTLYDSRADAMRHHINELNVYPVRIGRDTMPVREAMIVLRLARQARARGVIFSEEDIVTPHLTELLQRARVITGRTILRGDPE